MRTYGDHAFAPTSWACKKQTAVSHSTEVEVISLDIGQRTEGVHALMLLDLVLTCWNIVSSEQGKTSGVNPNPKLQTNPGIMFRQKSNIFERMFTAT